MNDRTFKVGDSVRFKDRDLRQWHGTVTDASHQSAGVIYVAWTGGLETRVRCENACNIEKVQS